VAHDLQSHPPPNLPLEGGGVKKAAPPSRGGVKKVPPMIPSPSRGGRGRGWDK